jgi:choline-glycine betaine transporter
VISAAPWWPIASVAILAVADGIAISAGRAIEAVIIGLLMVPGLFMVALWIRATKRRRT